MTRSFNGRVVWTNVLERAHQLNESEARRVSSEIRHIEPNVQIEAVGESNKYDAYDRAMSIV